MRVVVPPAVVNNRIVRVIASTPTLLEVEEWVGEWWEPSSVTLSEATLARSATTSEMDARGIPDRDRRADGERVTMQALTTSLSAPVQMSDAELMRPLERKRNGGRRRHEYTGSARFRKSRPTESRRADDADAGKSDWKGPWRRASDQQPHPPEHLQ